METVAVDKKGRVIDTFTFHTGQMRTYRINCAEHTEKTVHIPHRSDEDAQENISPERLKRVHIPHRSDEDPAVSPALTRIFSSSHSTQVR